METLTDDRAQGKKIQTVFRASAIRTRHSVLSDFGMATDFTFYSNSKNGEPFPSTESRMKEYRKHAASLSLMAIADCQVHFPFDPKTITHLITVSCTGMYAPGLDVDLVNHIPLQTSVNRTCINFMGCFAAISAIKTADAFCATSPDAKVLIVCTELCSLHFQKDFTDDTILANALFADGAAALLVEAKPVGDLSLCVKGFYSDILFDRSEQMAWTIGNLGFEMKLSAFVADVLKAGIVPLVKNLAQTTNTDISEIGHYAIHPGGKKILDVVAHELAISKEKLRASYETLRDYGNMSSPTILFVLKKLLEDRQAIKANNLIVGMAFGPGITMESMLLSVV